MAAGAESPAGTSTRAPHWSQNLAVGRVVAPHVRQRPPVHPQHIGVERDFHEDQRRIERAVGEEEQRQRNGDRGEPVPQRAVDHGGAKGDDDERKHLGGHQKISLPPS